jgi:exodeoxyribonuclease-5
MQEIHRQALDNPIIHYSNEVRNGRPLPYVKLPEFHHLRRSEASADIFLQADQIIVGRNKTRAAWNKRFRERKGITEALPRQGEKLICLKNNAEAGLFNGMIGEARADCVWADYNKFSLDFEHADDLRVWRGDIEGNSEQYDGYNPVMRQLERFDFAYAITCHKSQGSEFDNVVVFHEPIGRGVERLRWTYTAITLERKSVVVVEP